MRAEQESRVIRFGSYEADLRAGELRKNGARLKIQEQPFRVLAVLLEHAGELVTREQLRADLWPSDTFVDFDNSLNTDINKLREVLGDSAANPRFVETIPRHGYRFVAPVEALGRPGIEAGRVTPPWWRVWQARMGIAAGLLAVAAIAGWLYTRPAGASLNNASLAVLPLENLSHDPEQEYFADGMTNELITSLAKLSSLKVISRTSVMPYKGVRKNIRDVAKELRVGFVVEGSVYREGDRVRINTELIQASTDTSLWSDRYDRDLKDKMALQNEVARDIAREIHLRLTPQDEVRLREARPVDREAYQAYLKGRYYVGRATKDDLERAAAQFHKAISIDPTYALAYDGVAAYYLAADEYFLAPRFVVPRAREAAIRAGQLDPGAAEPHTSLGLVYYWHDWDWAAAEKEFRRSIELNNYPLAHAYLGWTMATQGRYPAAYEEMKRAQELDPLSPETNAYVAWILYFSGRYDEAVEQLNRTIAMDPNYWVSHLYLGHVYEKKKMPAKAIEEFEKARRIDSAIPEILAALGHAYAVSGRKSDALNVLEQLRSLRKQRYVPAYPEAVVLAGLGRNDEAFAKLEDAFEERSYYMTWLKIDPELESLHSDIRYKGLMRRVGLSP
jgi:TolB-like protein/DNA-binding winged helix-turn-helix (wHTH) protein/Tfp pilus assembly protein PilF